jgi:hypothetical protein
MSAPASAHKAVRRRTALIVERHHHPDPARCVAAIIKLLTYSPADPPAQNDETATAATATVSETPRL